MARAARGGVLIKGGAPLELLGSLDAIAFDKTGTLTKGEPHIQEIVPAPGIDKQDLMVVAIAVESQSDHPLAQAIAKNASAMMLIKMIDNFFIFQVFLSFQSMKIVVYLF